MEHPLDVADEVATQGWALLREFEPSLPTSKAFVCLGEIDRVEGLNEVQTLRPREINTAPPNTYSGNFGKGEFPLHTDLAHWAVPPRFLALRCIRGSSDVPTRILDSREVVLSIGQSTLRRALVQPRRPLRNGKQLLRLLEQVEALGQPMFRWDSIYLRPATLSGERVFFLINDYLSVAKTIDVTLLVPGDTLVIDNWRMLHGRAATPENALDRHIERTYLKALK